MMLMKITMMLLKITMMLLKITMMLIKNHDDVVLKERYCSRAHYVEEKQIWQGKKMSRGICIMCGGNLEERKKLEKGKISYGKREWRLRKID